MTLKKGYSDEIDERFSIHIAEGNKAEIKAIINLSLEVHKEDILKSYIHRIFYEFPKRDDVLWMYVKDSFKDIMISMICLVPLEWKIDKVTFPVCEMEFVGTLKSYRRKGFIKMLNQLYEKVMNQKGYLLSAIRGIPYYYRTLGYGYISSLDERISLPVSKIPPTDSKRLSIRKANSNEIDFIRKKYEDFVEKFYIYNKFNRKDFEFKYMNDKFDTEVRTTYILEDKVIKKNYFSIGMSYDNQCYEIVCPDLEKNSMIEILNFIKNLGNFSSNETITLSISENSSLFNYIKELGGTPFPSYGWQIKIPDLKEFFYLTKGILEERLGNSEFRSLTKTLRISNYRQMVEIVIKKGRISDIHSEDGYPDSEETDLRIPGAFLYKLLLGDKNFDELSYILKDSIVLPSSKAIIDILFPKRKSYLSSYI